MKRVAWLTVLVVIAAACGAVPASPGDAGSEATTTTPVRVAPLEPDRPPDFVVVAGDTELTVVASNYCWSRGADAERQVVCADGVPPEPLPRITLGETDDLGVRFPSDWNLEATLLPEGDPDNRRLVVTVEPDGSPIERLGPAGRYRVELFGRGDRGSAAGTFELITTTDRGMPPPFARVSWYPSGRDLEADAPFFALIGNLAAAPGDEVATVTVTAANGASQQYPLGRADPGGDSGSAVELEAVPGFTAEIIALGPPPYEATLTVAFDGFTVTSDPVRWPDDFPANSNESPRQAATVTPPDALP